MTEAHLPDFELRKWIEAKLEVIHAHIDRMDKASAVLNETVTRVPTKLEQAVAGLTGLFNERLNGVIREIDQANKVTSNTIHRVENTTKIQIANLEKLVTSNQERLTKAETTKATLYAVGSAGLAVVVAATALVVAVR